MASLKGEEGTGDPQGISGNLARSEATLRRSRENEGVLVREFIRDPIP